MKITILTLFPEVFSQILNTSILKRAQEKKLVNIAPVNIRDFTNDSYKTVDDRPYGGGVGMIMKVDVLYRAVSNVTLRQVQGDAEQSRSIKSQISNVKCDEQVILLDAKGKRFNQKKAWELSKYDHLILICGHYEGVDPRIEKYVDEIISIGDFVLTGGEIPAMAMVDAVIRLIPGVLKKEATQQESFPITKMENGKWKMENIYEYPQYTRPKTFRGQKVPEVLLSGDHAKIAKWRKTKQRKVTTPPPDVSR